MEAVFGIAYRTNSQDDADIGVDLLQECNTASEIVGTLLYREDLLCKESLWTLLAIIHNLACLVEEIHMVGAEGENGHIGHSKCGCFIRIHPLQRMQHAGRVIHHAERIHRGVEQVIGKPFPDIVGKAATHEKQVMMRFHLPR